MGAVESVESRQRDLRLLRMEGIALTFSPVTAAFDGPL
jgi:hypothetical protein